MIWKADPIKQAEKYRLIKLNSSTKLGPNTHSIQHLTHIYKAIIEFLFLIGSFHTRSTRTNFHSDWSVATSSICYIMSKMSKQTKKKKYLAGFLTIAATVDDNEKNANCIQIKDCQLHQLVIAFSSLYFLSFTSEYQLNFFCFYVPPSKGCFPCSIMSREMFWISNYLGCTMKPCYNWIYVFFLCYQTKINRQLNNGQATKN